MKKSELRKIYLAARKNLSTEEKETMNRLVVKRFFVSFDLRETKYLHCFLPIVKFDEIDTRPIFERVRRDFPRAQTLAPRVNFENSSIENVKFTPGTETLANIWQIDEPADGETVAPEKIDMILIPLLCFDKRGYRVGYGKGFYDGLLKTCRADCLKIGLSYFPPSSEIADVNEFDVKLDFCITPEQTLNFES